MLRIYCCKISGSSYNVRRLLGYAFSDIYGEKAPEIEKEPGGRPFFPGRPDVFFSLSHTKGYVLCAVSDFPTGADIEALRPIRQGLRERICAPEEQMDFFPLWTLKESYIKLIGRMEKPFREIKFICRDGKILPPPPAVSAGIYGCVPGCAAAVCSMSPELPQRLIIVPLEKLL